MARRSDVLGLAVLGLLHDSPLHGYELRKRLSATLGMFRALSYGSLYPALRALVDRGWIVEQDASAVREPVAAPRRRWPASGAGSSTSSPPTARSTSSTPWPSPARRPGRTATSTSGSRSSPASTPPPGCASSRAGGPG